MKIRTIAASMLPWCSFLPKVSYWFLHLGSTSQWLVMLYVTLYGVPWLTGESSMDTPCWESGSRDSLIAVFNSVSFWEDTDGLTVASVSIHLYFSGGRAVGSLTINTSLFTASCAVSPSPTWLDRDFLFRGSVDVKVSVCVFGPMTWDKDCWCSAL